MARVLDEVLLGAVLLGGLTRAEGGVKLDEGRGGGGVTEGKGVLTWADASNLGALSLLGVV